MLPFGSDGTCRLLPVTNGRTTRAAGVDVTVAQYDVPNDGDWRGRRCSAEGVSMRSSTTLGMSGVCRGEHLGRLTALDALAHQPRCSGGQDRRRLPLGGP